MDSGVPSDFVLGIAREQLLQFEDRAIVTYKNTRYILQRKTFQSEDRYQ
jgi:hypothetical protein